jgi:hypothetical protein
VGHFSTGAGGSVFRRRPQPMMPIGYRSGYRVPDVLRVRDRMPSVHRSFRLVREGVTTISVVVTDRRCRPERAPATASAAGRGVARSAPGRCLCGSGLGHDGHRPCAPAQRERSGVRKIGGIPVCVLAQLARACGRLSSGFAGLLGSVAPRLLSERSRGRRYRERGRSAERAGGLRGRAHRSSRRARSAARRQADCGR